MAAVQSAKVVNNVVGIGDPSQRWRYQVRSVQPYNQQLCRGFTPRGINDTRFTMGRRQCFWIESIRGVIEVGDPVLLIPNPVQAKKIEHWRRCLATFGTSLTPVQNLAVIFEIL
jgi:hypothetical protein